MRSLLFLLLVVFATLAHGHDNGMRHDPGSDVERYWHGGTSGTNMEDDVQKFSK